MSDQSAGPGYWQASDGKWYPPESHPDAIAQQAAPVPPTPTPTNPSIPNPATPGAVGQQASPSPGSTATPPGPGYLQDTPTESGSSKPIYLRAWFLIAAGLLVVIGLAVAVGAGSDDDVAVTADDATSQGSAQDGDSNGSESDSAAESDTDDAAGSDNDSGEDPQPQTTTTAPIDFGDAGSVGSPWSFDATTPVVFDTYGDADGSLWNAEIGSIRDVTATVLETNQYNDPPPDNVVFAGFDVSMMLIAASKEPLSVGFNVQWEIVGGATASVYDSSTIETENYGCGSTPDEFDDWSEAFAGGVMTGLICIPIPAEDLGHPDTKVALNFGSNRVYFAAGGATADAYATPDAFVRADVSADRDGSRFAPWAMGEIASVIFDSYGDADGSVWDIKAGPIQDITADVLAENQFNDAPPEGTFFAGFDIEMTLVSAEVEPLSVGFNMTWEIVGGQTARAYAPSTINTGSYGCGVIPNEFDDYAEVFAGGTVTGTICIPLPIADLGDPNTEVSINFSDSRVYFGP